jgi:hypothetical protein
VRSCVQQSRARQFASFVVLTSMLVVCSAFGSKAAEIGCVLKVPDNHQFTAENRAELLKSYPSGRLPAAGTCLRILIQGNIEIGDSAKFSELVRKSHPFLSEVVLWSSGGLVEEAMKIGRLIRRGLRRIAVTLLVAGIPAANAAPLVPPGDQPGRERYRFTPSPLDRFMQPAPPERPLLRWGCGHRSVSRSQQRSRRDRNC